MTKVVLQPGDLFATRSSSALGVAIRFVQWVWSWDREAPYNHVGIITSADGKTLEARWRFKEYNINDYAADKVLIVRHKEMTEEAFKNGMAAVAHDVGCLYPAYRIPLFLIPPLAKFKTGAGVCSEQTAEFMKGAGFMNVTYGLTPDNLADLWRVSKSMDIIFEGVWGL